LVIRVRRTPLHFFGAANAHPSIYFCRSDTTALPQFEFFRDVYANDARLWWHVTCLWTFMGKPRTKSRGSPACIDKEQRAPTNYEQRT
jgi:hypothetical protein